MDRTDLNKLSTFDLAFNIATGKYNESEKFVALDIIKSRDLNTVPIKSVLKQSSEPKTTKKPLKGSKAEKILNLYEVKGMKTAREIKDQLIKQKVVAYYPEIYRVLRKYTNFE